MSNGKPIKLLNYLFRPTRMFLSQDWGLTLAFNSNDRSFATIPRTQRSAVKIGTKLPRTGKPCDVLYLDIRCLKSTKDGNPSLAGRF